MKLMIDTDGTQRWYQHGKRHRDHDKPAVIYFDGPSGSVGTQKWYQKDQVHRDGDKPAIIHADGTQYWYQHDRLHRVGGPAIIKADGSQSWYQNDNLYFPSEAELEAWEKKKRRLLVQQCGVLIKLSDRVRPNSEAAPWVIEEIEALESDLENAMQHFDMTMKAYQEEIEIHKQDETLLRQALEALQWEHARTLVLLEIHKQDETLLRQALEALEQYAIEEGATRCAGAAIAALRERLGEEA